MENELEYYKQKLLEQLIEPKKFPYVQDRFSGRYLTVHGGMVRLNDNEGFDLTISVGNLFEVLKKGLEEWKK